MRKVGCIFGWLFALATFAVAGWEYLARDPEKGFELRPAGQMWFLIDKDSLGLFQVVVERYIWPPLWEHVFFNLLQLPSIVIPLVPALVLVALCAAGPGAGGAVSNRPAPFQIAPRRRLRLSAGLCLAEDLLDRLLGRP